MDGWLLPARFCTHLDISRESNSAQTRQQSFEWDYKPRPPNVYRHAERPHTHVTDPVVHTKVWWNRETLTLSLPCLSPEKRSIKVPNLKLIRPFLPFARARERISIKMHGTESRSVTGPSNTLFAGMCGITFQARKFYRLRQQRG